MLRLAGLLALGAFMAVPPSAAGQTLEDFSQLPAISSVDISADGRWLAVGCVAQDRESLCLYDLASGSEPRLFNTPEGFRLNQAYFAGPEHLVMEGEFFTTLPTGNGPRDYRFRRSIILDLEEQSIAMLMNNIQDITDNRNVVSLNRSDPDSVLVEYALLVGGEREGGNLARSRERMSSTLMRVDLDSGEGRRVETDFIQGRVVDVEGEVVAHILHDQENHTYEVRRMQGGRQTLYEAVHLEDTPWIAGFADETGLVMVFSEGEHRGLNRLDLETGALTRIPIGEPGAYYEPIIDEHTDRLVGIWAYEDNLPVQYFLDDQLARDAGALRNALGADRVLVLAWSQNRSLVAIEALSDGEPPAVFLYDRAGGSLSPIGEDYPGLAGLPLGATQPFSYTASDGLEIPAFLTLPPGKTRADGPFPLVVLPHGGPSARDDLEFDWWTQAYAGAGYAVLRANFRGSEGYGEDFRSAGFGEFGGRMIEDVLDGARHLRETGVAEREGACFVGASYGGYVALMAAIKAPQEVACTVAVAPVTDPLELLGRAYTSRSDMGLAFWERYIGDRYMSGDAAAAISPVRLTGQLTVPALVIHGAEDLIVPVHQSRNLASQMGGSANFTYIELEGENHHLRSSASRLRILRESLALMEATIGQD